MDKEFWSNVGSGTAKGLTAAGKGVITGLTFVGKYTTKAAKVTGKAFSDEWKKQHHNDDKDRPEAETADCIHPNANNMDKEE